MIKDKPSIAGAEPKATKMELFGSMHIPNLSQTAMTGTVSGKWEKWITDVIIFCCLVKLPEIMDFYSKFRHNRDNLLYI